MHVIDARDSEPRAGIYHTYAFNRPVIMVKSTSAPMVRRAKTPKKTRRTRHKKKRHTTHSRSTWPSRGVYVIHLLIVGTLLGVSIAMLIEVVKIRENPPSSTTTYEGSTNSTTYITTADAENTTSLLIAGVVTTNNETWGATDNAFRHVQINDPSLDMARGVSTNVASIHRYMSNPAVGTTYEYLQPSGGVYAWPTGSSTLEVVSAGAADDVSGAGAQQVTITGVDINFVSITDVVNTVGSGTSTATTQSFYRVDQVVVSRVGTFHGSNFNDITIRISGGGATQAQILGGFGTVNSALYGAGGAQAATFTVPMNTEAYITRVDCHIDAKSSKQGDIALWAYTHNHASPALCTDARRLKWSADGVIGQLTTIFDSYLRLPQRTDIWMEAKATATAVIGCNLDIRVVATDGVL